jgi:hypothetical protein
MAMNRRQFAKATAAAGALFQSAAAATLEVHPGSPSPRFTRVELTWKAGERAGEVERTGPTQRRQ